MNSMKRVLAVVFILATSPVHSEIVKASIDGVIDPITSEFITGVVREAEERNAEFLLIELSTPGGLGVSMQEIIQVILNSQVPIVCYVRPKGARAASAGFFILLSADVAVMAPGTNTGAAHPVFPFGGGNETIMEKVRNDALAGLRSIVNQRKRNYELAEKGVVESKSYTETEALEGGLIDLIAENEEELLQALEGREITRFTGEKQRIVTQGHIVSVLEMTWRQTVLSTIADPNVALILGVLGLLGLYLEFTNPGLLVPGIVGGICFLLALLGFSIVPVNFIGVLLIILALGLFVAEVKVQGFGLFGFGGIVAMLLGLLILVDAPNPEVRIRLEFALAIAVSFGIIMIFLTRLAVKSQMGRVVTGAEALIDMTGRTRTPVNAEGGKVFVNGEWWEAISGEPIGTDMKVRVLKAQDLVLTVMPLTQPEHTSQERGNK